MSESAGTPPLSDAGRRNIEIKASVEDMAEARRVAESVATERLGILIQTDTYFRCSFGRLKVREIEGQRSELIWYERADESGPRPSRYGLTEIDDATCTKADLTRLLGVQLVVEKRRELFLFHNVRIHLDSVAQLGEFVEFEAVVDSENDEATGRDRIAHLRTRFEIDPGQLIPVSYSDLLAEQR